ncbi:GNAT family N-acetyltransferase [Pseudomonas brassicae]
MGLAVVASTPRTSIVLPDAALAERVNQALIDSFVAHQPFLPWAKASPALQDTRNNLRQALLDHAQAHAEKRYFILTPDQAAVIGCVGLHPGSAGEHVLGYWANSGFSGQGLMAEGIRALLAAQDFGTLQLTAASVNGPSHRLARALGFEVLRVVEGVRDTPWHGVHDTWIFERKAQATASARCEVREARADDAPAISRVIIAALRHTNSQDYSAAVIARVEASFSPQAVAGLLARRQVLVAQVGAEVVGTASLEGEVVRTVFVAPRRHGLGIGRALMQRVEALALAAGVQTLRVPSSLTAQGFYAHLGYAVLCEVVEGEERTVVMARVLTN